VVSRNRGAEPGLCIALLRHVQVLFVQAQQSAPCNASHTVEARLARWLLRSRDLSGDETLALTEEFLAEMLGMQRSSVSPVALPSSATGGADRNPRLAGLRGASRGSRRIAVGF
jgi:CRP-like cAMP-binding protein